MRFLVAIGWGESGIEPDGLGVLSRAAAVCDDVSAVICADAVPDVAAVLGRHGARKVFVLQSPAFGTKMAAPLVGPMAELCRREGFDALLAPTNALTVDLAAALAVTLKAGLAWGLVDIGVRDGKLRGSRLTQNDSVIAEMGWRGGFGIGLIRPWQFAAVPDDAALPALVEVIAAEADVNGARLLAFEPVAAAEGPALASADIVVSGGRGIGRPENLALVRELAESLGGAAGVSLPLVEMGWAPRAMQVGQTGTIVKPKLYVACGISGQIQHRIGIEQSGTIVAINKDPTAPIMGFCDLAVVGTVEGIVPALIGLLRERRKKEVLF
jgi:electron transfer flavoprotein alpha subunit